MSQSAQRLRQPVVVVLGHVDSGKCVSGETLLELGDGRILTAQSAFETFRRGTPVLRPDGEVYEAGGLLLLSASENGKVSPRKVSHVWKLKSNRLVRVRTRAGHHIETTPEHKFMTFTSNRELRYVEAESLRLGDHLLIPARIEAKPWGMVQLKLQILESLSDDFLIEIKGDFKVRIEEYCHTQGLYKLGKEIGDRSLWYHVKRGFYRASVLRELAQRAGMLPEQLYEDIERIKYSSPKRRASHKSFWLKVPQSEHQLSALYYMTGLLFGDGIRKNAYLNNTCHFLIKEFQDCLRECFDVGVSVHWRRTSYVMVHRGGLTLSKFLVQVLGYPETDKTHSLVVPPIVCAAPDRLLARFLQGFFDAGGWVEKRNILGVSCESRTLMRQLPILLHRFGCLGYFAKKRNRLELMISGATSIRSFVENIDFMEPGKAELARKAMGVAISNRIFDRTPVDGSFAKGFRKTHEIHGSRDFQLNYLESRKQLTNYALTRLLGLGEAEDERVLSGVLTNYRMVQVSQLEAMEGDFTVYDFTVEETGNFMANNMIVHNTSLLDKIRGTAVQAREAGGITQEIGASFFPMETLEKICGPILTKTGGELKIPGLLVIDTPGHEIFSNLRERGGSAADIAIVVVDVQKGLENQTLESIEILKQRRVPFLVALNKVDMIKGWKKDTKGYLLDALKEQPPELNDELEERLYNVVGGLSGLGFESDAFYRVKDFRKQVSIVPVSARYGVGIPELLAMLIGLAQQFLGAKLSVIEEKTGGRGIILEMQEEVGIGQTANVILTEGKLKVGDMILVVKRDGGHETKVKALFMPKPLDEMRDPRDKFTSVNEVYSAAGVKLVSSDLEGVIPGTPVVTFTNEQEFLAAKGEAEKDLLVLGGSKDTVGVLVKAGSIGGLEALLQMLKERNIPVRLADIGDISKTDFAEANMIAEHDPYLGVILGFDVKVLPEAKDAAEQAKLFLSEVIYEVIENYSQWADQKRTEDERIAISSLTLPAKIRALPGNFFRRNDPAIFGVEIVAGRLRSKARLMGPDGKEVGVLEQIQDQGKPVEEARAGAQVAISVKGPTLGRQVKENDFLYTFPTSREVKLLRTKFAASLTEDEKLALDEILRLRSASDPLYGF